MLFLTIKTIIIIAAILSFLTFTTDSIAGHMRGGSRVPNIFLKRNAILCIFIIACSICIGDNIFSQKAKVTLIAVILILTLIITFYYKFILGYIKTKRINDAILYGIKGNYWVKYYDDNYEKIYLVRKYTNQHNFYKSSSEDNQEKYYGLLDLYDNETHNYVRTISEELLWDMIKSHRDKNKGSSLFQTFRYYRILQPSLQYGAYRINKASIKELFAQYEQTHNITIDYEFISSEGEELLMIYNKDIKVLKNDIPHILAKALE